MNFSLGKCLLAFTLLAVLIGVPFSRMPLLLVTTTIALLAAIWFALALAIILGPGRTRSFYIGMAVLGLGTLLGVSLFSQAYDQLANSIAFSLLNSQQPANPTTGGYPVVYPPVPAAPNSVVYPASTFVPNGYAVYQPAGVPAPLPVTSVYGLEPLKTYLIVALAFLLGIGGGIVGIYAAQTRETLTDSAEPFVAD